MGAWLKDPLPSSLRTRSQVWTQIQRDSGRYVFKRYDSYDDFIESREDVYPERTWFIDGVGSVLHQGVLYFHYTNHIYRYNLTSNDVSYQLLTTAAYTRGQQAYVRFHSDEYGLWVSYPDTASRRLRVAALDPHTLALSGTQELAVDIFSVVGVVVVCGKVYVVRRTRPSDKHYLMEAVYDLVKRETIYSPQPPTITTIYSDVSQMTYNPREKRVFGWDNYHQVTWQVVWKHPARP